MEYQIEEIKENIDIIKLNDAEFHEVNALFRKAIKARFPQMSEDEVMPVQRAILTDRFHRVEFLLKHEDDY